jgi:hypothetical protein
MELEPPRFRRRARPAGKQPAIRVLTVADTFSRYSPPIDLRFCPVLTDRRL